MIRTIPLDDLTQNISEIIEMTDESDFKNYTHEHYEQEAIADDEDEEEEFLEDDEK